MNILHAKDYIVFIIYFLIVPLYGWWVYNRKKSAQASSKDYFFHEFLILF